jgi:hypothetical protein
MDAALTAYGLLEGQQVIQASMEGSSSSTGKGEGRGANRSSSSKGKGKRQGTSNSSSSSVSGDKKVLSAAAVLSGYQLQLLQELLGFGSQAVQWAGRHKWLGGVPNAIDLITLLGLDVDITAIQLEQQQQQQAMGCSKPEYLLVPAVVLPAAVFVLQPAISAVLDADSSMIITLS